MTRTDPLPCPAPGQGGPTFVQALAQSDTLPPRGGPGSPSARQTEGLRDPCILNSGSSAAPGRDEFLAWISHEFRTPLASVLALTERLRDPDAPLTLEDQRRSLSLIEECSRHLARLAEDFLDLARLEAGVVRLQIEPCPVADIVAGAVRILRPQAERRDLKLIVHPTTDDVLVLADPLRLKQILVNLLANAIRFTPPRGLVSLTVSADALTVSFTVADTGCGIPPDKVPALFQPFARIHPDPGSDSGSGLGLAIVQRFTQLLHGRVTVESEPDVGSRFCVTLPRGNSSDPGLIATATATTDRTESHLPLESPIRVLLTEDNDLNRTLMASHLVRHGFEVLAVTGGEQALRLFLEARPEVVLLDIQMPGMDGLEVARRIRSHPDPALARVPILALTALASPGDRERCLASGISQYLSKPVRLGDLARHLRALVTRHSLPGPVSITPSSPDA